MQRLVPVSKEIEDFILSEFVNTSNLELDKFDNPRKRVLLFHSAPFIDEDSYCFVNELVKINELKQLKFFGLPLESGDCFLELADLPERFIDFRAIMEESKLHYTGGLGFDGSKEFLFYSSADVEILSLQVSDQIIIPELGRASEFILTNEAAQILINDHLDFLSLR